MNSDLQYCMFKLSQASPDTLSRVKNVLDRKVDCSDSLITKKAAADALHVSRATFWRMLKTGILPVVTVFNGIQRIRLSDVQQLIASTHAYRGEKQ